MKGIVLVFMLMTQSCYGMEYVNALCITLGGQGYNCTEDGPVCCQYTIMNSVYFFAAATFVTTNFCLAKCCRRKKKYRADVIPSPPKTLSKDEIKKIEARNDPGIQALLQRRS